MAERAERVSFRGARRGTSVGSNSAPAAPVSNGLTGAARHLLSAPPLLVLDSARHLLWLLDYHTRPTTAEPARGQRRPAAVEIATSTPRSRIEAR